jgi:hypothetical protein
VGGTTLITSAQKEGACNGWPSKLSLSLGSCDFPQRTSREGALRSVFDARLARLTFAVIAERSARVNGYIKSPHGFKVGETWYAYLKIGGDGVLYAFAGSNGLFLIDGNDLVYETSHVPVTFWRRAPALERVAKEVEP